MRSDRLDILVVDDELTMRRLISGMLRSLGPTEFHEASDGSAALQMLRDSGSCRPHLAIVDLHMEPMNGIQFGRAVRSGDHAAIDRFIPLILITGDKSPDAIKAALNCGFDDILPKPCPPAMILERAKRLLTAERPFAHAKGGGTGGTDYFGPATKWVRDTILSKREHKMQVRPPVLAKAARDGGAPVSWMPA